MSVHTEFSLGRSTWGGLGDSAVGTRLLAVQGGHVLKCNTGLRPRSDYLALLKQREDNDKFRISPLKRNFV